MIFKCPICGYPNSINSKFKCEACGNVIEDMQNFYEVDSYNQKIEKTSIFFDRLNLLNNTF